LRRLFDEILLPAVALAAELTGRGVRALPLPGRPMAAAQAGLPRPDEPLAALWHDCTVLREHRGDGHLAAVAAADLVWPEPHLLQGSQPIIGGEPRRFAPLVDLYRRAGAEAGHAPETLQVGLHVFGYVGDSVRSAADTIYPGWQQDDDDGRARARLPATDPSAVRRHQRPDGAFFMGDPGTVATKLRRVHDQLGGVDRVSLQMTNSRLAHADLLRGVELLGTGVAPRVADL